MNKPRSPIREGMATHVALQKDATPQAVVAKAKKGVPIKTPQRKKP